MQEIYNFKEQDVRTVTISIGITNVDEFSNTPTIFIFIIPKLERR